MYNIQNDHIHAETIRKLIRLRIKYGFLSITKSRIKALLVALYVAGCVISRAILSSLYNSSQNMFSSPILNFYLFMYPILAVILFVVLMYIFGIPKGSIRIHNGLRQAGLLNHANEAGYLLSVTQDADNPNLKIYELLSPGITEDDVLNQRGALEAAINCYLIDFKHGKTLDRLLLSVVPGDSVLPPVIEWSPEYLLNNDAGSFELVAGLSLAGQKVTLPLHSSSHILIGGVTGCGKTVLSRTLALEFYCMGGEIYIVDLKGGLDFPPSLSSKPGITLAYDTAELLSILRHFTEEIEKRKKILRDSDSANIQEHNKKVALLPDGDSLLLPRYLLFVDEVASAVERTGRSKEKELIDEILSHLSSIARLGRSFGLHLLLSTQRPDYSLLPASIKSNLEIRIAGRSDQVLSQIILDSTVAATDLPRGRNGMHIVLGSDGNPIIFQGLMSHNGDFDIAEKIRSNKALEYRQNLLNGRRR